jgi:hypothetical protein
MLSSAIGVLLRGLGRLRLLRAFYLFSGPRSVLGIRHLGGTFVGGTPCLLSDNVANNIQEIASIQILELCREGVHGRRLRVDVFLTVLRIEPADFGFTPKLLDKKRIVERGCLGMWAAIFFM